jgi:hypothetical protein
MEPLLTHFLMPSRVLLFRPAMSAVSSTKQLNRLRGGAGRSVACGMSVPLVVMVVHSNCVLAHSAPYKELKSASRPVNRCTTAPKPGGYLRRACSSILGFWRCSFTNHTFMGGYAQCASGSDSQALRFATGAHVCGGRVSCQEHCLCSEVSQAQA